MKKRWWQSKAVWTGITGAIVAIGAAATGETTWVAGIQNALTSLAVVFVRTGMINR